MGCDENRMSINLAAAVFVAVSILKALKTEDLSRKLEVNYVKFQFRGGLLVPTGRTPSVERLPFNLKDGQQVIYDATESIDYAVDKSSVNETKFESWMDLNKNDTFARTLLYVEIPKFFVWNQNQRIWTRRKQGLSLGRIHHVPPSWGELYYLRAILNKVRGPLEWDDLKKDDKEYIDGLLEASFWGMGDYLRSIFVMLIMTDSMPLPEIVWEKTWTVMAAEVLNVERIKQGIPENMSYPDQDYTIVGYNRLIYDETSYNKDKLREEHVKLYGSFTTEQKGIYSTVMEAVDNNKGGMFFVYGYGGTGKTYLYKTMSAVLRSKGDIILNVALSGIATLLLEGGRTAHSRFAIPINVLEDSMCHISADDDLVDLIRKEKLIIWDEAPMINRHCYEAFDRTLRDICRTDPSVASDKVFGGKVVLFGGDFRQTLPVITNGSRQDVVNATINASYLWDKCIVLRLTVNMRLGYGTTQYEKKEIQEFADWILDIGNRKVGGANDGESNVVFPDNMLIPETDDDVGAIIDDSYPDLLQNLWNASFSRKKQSLLQSIKWSIL
ncbi:ATP-dependent DNA helicase RRM3-like protein [Tanacetum coccineum]